MKTPTQASRIYNLDGNSPPRPKHLFAVRFRRSFPATTDWDRDLCFVAKSVDRPSITAEHQEVSQYGKKRLVYTGWKGQPVKISFQDTADSLAARMWADYAAYYFGDFAQVNDTPFRYDVVTQRMLAEGFGYRPRPGTESSGINSQYFFDAIEIIQVFGGYYVQTDLINPKIISYDGDELSYEQSEMSTITISAAYESILYKNNGYPVPITSDSRLMEMFGNQFYGDTPEVSGPQRITGYGTGAQSEYASNNLAAGIGTILTGGAIAAFQQSNGFTNGGALGIFGRYVFGATNNAVNSATGINVASLATVTGIGDLFRR